MPPLRSCSQNEKPPEAPRPGIAGGMKANAAASGILARNSWLSSAISACAVLGDPRSSHGFSQTK